MDQKNADEWLKQAKTAMDEAAPGIVTSVEGMLEQRVAIMEVGMRAFVQAAVRDALGETISQMIGTMFRDPLTSAMDGGASPLAFTGGGVVGETAVRRFLQ